MRQHPRPAADGTYGRAGVVARAHGLLAAVAALALLLPACSGADSRAEVGEVLEGDTVEVDAGDGWEPAEPGRELADGTRVRTRSGDGRLQTPQGELWLGPRTAVTFDDGHVELVRGDVLTIASGTARIGWGMVDVVGDGVYRLTAGVTPRLAVYRGRADVRRPGELRALSGLSQVDLALPRLPAIPAPLAYRDDDPWDRQLLASAIAFDAEAARLARGIDRQFGTEPRDEAFYEAFVVVEPRTLPVLRRTSRLVDGELFGPPSDALLTLFVARAAADAFDRSILEVARDVGDLRSRGARWGLVAVDLGVGTRELARVADLAQERRIAVGIPDGPPPSVSDVTPGPAPGGARDPDPLRPADEPPESAPPSDDGDPSEPPSPPSDDTDPPSRRSDPPNLPITLPEPVEPIADAVPDAPQDVEDAVDAVSDLVEDVVAP